MSYTKHRHVFFVVLLGVLVVSLVFVFGWMGRVQATYQLTVSGLNPILGGYSDTFQFSFRASSPADDIGEGVHLDLPDDFSGHSSMTIDDVDFLIDGAQLTLQSSCVLSTDILFTKTDLSSLSSVWRYSFTACGENAINPGELIQMRLGTNTSYQTIGTNYLITPSTPGLLNFAVSGQAGSADRTISLGDETNPATGYVNLSGTVLPAEDSSPDPTPSPGSGSGGGGGGGGGMSSSSLVISDVIVEIVNPQTAVVTWNTNQPSTSEVNYGITPSFGRHWVNRNYVVSHRVTLSNLQPGQTYFYQPISRTSLDVTATGSTGTFTMPAVDHPVISDLQAVNVTSESADIIWYTNKPAGYVLDYGVNRLEYSKSNPSLRESQVVNLRGLESGQVYSVRVQAIDDVGNKSSYAYISVNTDIESAPGGVMSFLGTRAGDGVHLSWTYPNTFHNGVRLYRFDGVRSGRALSGDPIYTGDGSGMIDVDVDPGKDYTYCVALISPSDEVSAESCLFMTVDIGTELTLKVKPQKRERSPYGRDNRMLSTIRETTETAPTQQATFLLNRNGFGSYTLLRNVEEEAYVAVKGLSHLRQMQQVDGLSATEAEYVDFTEGETKVMKAGDIYQTNTDLFYQHTDNFINVLDLSVLIRHLSTTDLISDLDRDDYVSSLDLSLIVRNLNATGESE